MGASYLDRNLAALATGGRLVIIGLQGGINAQINLSTLLNKRAAIIAASLRARPVEEKSAIVTSVREHLWPLITSEPPLVRPVVHAYVPMPEASRAHEILDASTHIGKVLLVAPDQ